jgi:hypothetical protein
MTVDTTEMTTNVHEPFDQYRPREGPFALCRFSDQARLRLRRPSEAVKPGLIAATRDALHTPESGDGAEI